MKVHLEMLLTSLQLLLSYLNALLLKLSGILGHLNYVHDWLSSSSLAFM